jgi:hypothetical protein
MKNAIKSRSDIPNQAGFVLVLIRADGSEQLAKVVKGPDGCHYCATPSGKRIDLTGKADERPAVEGCRDYVAPIGPDVPGLICNPSPGLYTREQIRQMFANWECTENPPAKGKAVFVNLPPGADSSLVAVNVWDGKSTEGQTLFAVWFYRRAN